MEPMSHPTMRRLRTLFETLYGEAAARCLQRLAMVLGRYPGIGCERAPPDEKEIVLITYGDSIQQPGEPPLRTLDRFVGDYLDDVVGTVHILPFFPYSSDDGFSIIDYREVRPDLGGWVDVERLGKRVGLMFDLVLNHCSRKNRWFRGLVAGVAPGRHFFHVVDSSMDVEAVVRPRDLPLLTKTQTRHGEVHVWTTFGPDQVDLDFSNPDVLFEFIDILLLYVSKGTRILRLDAVAYLWKKSGTSCIHLEETHQVVKLLRGVLELVAPGVLLLTETNVPHEENVSYFGDGDEAHMVYQFSLPPLLLHAILQQSAETLREWLRSLDEGAATDRMFLNFTASHDGIGVRPLEGLVPAEDIHRLVLEVEEREGRVSYRQNGDGQSPYELNISYFDAVRGSEEWGTAEHVERFLCTQTIALELRGVPAVYIHSLTATPNDYEGMARTGQPRSINRRSWSWPELEGLLDDAESATALVFEEYRRRIRLRREHRAFHPLAPQEIPDSPAGVLAVRRIALDGGEVILCLNNVTGEPQDVAGLDPGAGVDLLDSNATSGVFDKTLAPFASRWWLLRSEEGAS